MDGSSLTNKKKNDVQARRLSLIDVSSEDDSLIGLASDYPQDHQSSGYLTFWLKHLVFTLMSN